MSAEPTVEKYCVTSIASESANPTPIAGRSRRVANETKNPSGTKIATFTTMFATASRPPPAS